MPRIRITGGQWRSRLIQVADAPGLRPTPDRVRETLFNWLGQDLTGLTVLDLFAGSGILGLEAASRGARTVSFVERDRRAFQALQQHLAIFQDPAASMGEAPELQAFCADALHFAARTPVDLLLLDPPYRQGLLERLAPRLPLLARPEARLYAEAEHPLDSLGPWRVVKRGQAGQVFYHLLEPQ
jgi:16S rRNA (guanine966-N2)-methyltransferase